jgi:hypothetical protein
MQISVEQHLAHYRQVYGEEAWKNEVTRLALAGIRLGAKHEEFWRDLTKDYEWLNWDELKKQASEPMAQNSDTLMAELLRRQMPGIKTQAQYDAVLGALDAVRLVLNAILDGQKDHETAGRQALEMAFEAASKATEITTKLEDTPEAATSKAAEAFKEPPAQFKELEDQRRMLAEVDSLTTVDALNVWYADTKSRRDRIVTQSLRNELIDAIRTKRNALLS